MVASRTKRYLPDFAKNVLQAPERTREQAAWELLYAVRELFPDRYAELRALGQRIASEFDDERDEEDKDNKQSEDRFWRAVHDWTVRNEISCEAVDDAAAKYAVGDSASAGVYLDAHFDENGNLVFHNTPSITANPYDETREEFLKRAGRYYDDLSQRYAVKDAVKRGLVKRELAHFRYLAAHLVGKASFAEMADDPARFQVPAATEKTMAGEARKVAGLIGLPVRTIPGPRPGSRRRRAAQRVRR